MSFNYAYRSQLTRVVEVQQHILTSILAFSPEWVILNVCPKHYQRNILRSIKCPPIEIDPWQLDHNQASFLKWIVDNMSESSMWPTTFQLDQTSKSQWNIAPSDFLQSCMIIKSISRSSQIKWRSSSTQSIWEPISRKLRLRLPISASSIPSYHINMVIHLLHLTRNNSTMIQSFWIFLAGKLWYIYFYLIHHITFLHHMSASAKAEHMSGQCDHCYCSKACWI